MEEFFKKIYDFLSKNKDPHLRFPKNVDSIMDERNSRWSFILNIENSSDNDRDIAFLTGGIDASRFQAVDASGRYTALGGGLVTTPYPEGTIINLNDDPRLINKVSGQSCDCVASQEHQNSAVEQAIPEQTIYKDATGSVTVTSKEFFWNFLKDFIKGSPVRIFELQITSDNINLFSSRILIKEINPFTKDEPEYINLEDYYKPDNTSEVKIIVDSPFTLTAETFMSLIVPAHTLLSLGFRASAYHSEGNAIKNKLKVGSFLANLKTSLEKPLPKKPSESATTSTTTDK